jgi:hypothetical protein
MALPLTVANPGLQAKIDATPGGMMHWAGTGPIGKVCHGCVFFDQRILRGPKERETPEEVRGACDKYNRIMAAREGHGVRRRIFHPTTPACSHFEEAL